MNRGASTVLGVTSTDSSGNPNSSASREYCVPGDSSTCNPPVGEWKLDEKTGTSSVNDTSGNNQTGTLNGAMTESDWTNGKVGGALLFDGENDYISVTDTAQLSPTTALTVEGWVYLDALPGDPGKDAFFGGIQKNGGYSGYGNYGFRISSGKAIQFMLAHGTGVGELDSLTSSTILQKNRWYHIAVTYDQTASQRYIYVDGKIDASSNSYSQTLLDSGDSFIIGAGDNRFFSGKIDDIRVYNYARTPAQIAWDYNRGKPLAHWKLDECSGTNIYDSMGNQSVGTLSIGTSGTNTSPGSCSGSSGEAWADGSSGKFNSSLEFDGTDDYINLATITEDAISYSAWVKTSNSGIVASQGSGSYIYPPHGGIAVLGNKARMYSGYIDSTYRYAESSKTVNDGQWHHIVGVSDSTGTYVYVDGTLDGQDTYKVSDSAVNPTLFGIGAQIRTTDTQFLFTGQIDDVRIYNYALTPTQVRSLYNNSSAVSFTE